MHRHHDVGLLVIGVDSLADSNEADAGKVEIFTESDGIGDLLALEQIFAAEGTSAAGIEEAKRVSHGLGLFVRSLVGLDRAAAKRSFASFLEGKTLTANQIEFVDPVIDHLSRRGWIEASQLYESPFIDLHPHGVDGVFSDPEVREMLSILTSIRQNAEGREMTP
jgi:type I restriction enzyme R subunit